MRRQVCRLNMKLTLGTALAVLAGLLIIVASAAAGQLYYVPNEYIIHVQSGTSDSTVESLVDKMGASVVSKLPLPNMYQIKLGRISSMSLSGSSSSSLRSSSVSKWVIDYIQPNYLYSLSEVPNDPDYDNQWGLEMIDMPGAWDIEKGSDKVVVGVIDSGVAKHPDFGNRVLTGYDFVDNDTDASNDTLGHGTFVAGIIAAEADNGEGIAGVCWENVKILPIRAFSGKTASTSVLLTAEQYALDQGVEVLNMSYGAAGEDTATQDMMKKLNAAGTILVAAAGNEATSIPNYPAACDEVISVSALGPDENLASYSNYGSTIDIAAPGGSMSSTTDPNGIYSTTFTIDSSTGGYTYDYGYEQGTSFASPHVAGAAALLLSYGVPASEVRGRLLNSARVPKSGILDPLKYGAGVLDVKASLASSNIKILQPSKGGTVSTNPTFKISLKGIDSTSIKVYLDYTDANGNGVPDNLDDTSSVIINNSNISTYLDPESNVITVLYSKLSLGSLSIGEHWVYVRGTSTADGSEYTDWATFNVTGTTFSPGLHLISLPFDFTKYADDGTLSMSVVPENLFVTKDGDPVNFTLSSTSKAKLIRWVAKASSASGSGYFSYPDSSLAWENPIDSNISNSWYTGGGFIGGSTYAFPAGSGFWLMVPGTDDILLNDTYAKNPVDSNTAYSTCLYKGWNMFGNPYNDQVSWSNALFTYRGIRKSLADAQAAGWIASSVYYYTQTPSRGYQRLANRDVLEPFTGYWIYALVGGVSSSDSLVMTIIP